MEKTKALKEIYNLYTEWKYSEAKVINDQVLESEPNNMYSKRYQNLLEQKMKSELENTRKWPIPTVKGKSLKCPHCISKIALSWLTQGQKDRIRNKDLDNLEIKCPYCHTEFMLQKKTARSLIGIKLWDKVNYKQKTYRTVGYIEYKGNWYDWNYSWKTQYLEWILLWNDNSYLYFSEGYSIDDWEKIYEFDFSYKDIPEHLMGVNFDNKTFSRSWTDMKMKEYSKVKVTSAYWENSKSFKIGEDVMLAPSKVNWVSYVYEKESSWNQVEVWIYKTDKVNEKLARQMFNKSSANNYSNKKQHSKNNLWLFGQIFFWWIFVLTIFSEHINIQIILYWIWIIFLWLFIYKLPTIIESSSNNTQLSIMYKLLVFIIIWPLFMYTVIIPLTNIVIENKKEIAIENIENWKKIELNFPSWYDKVQVTTSTKKYDYGGVRTYYKENEWFKFSVESEEDISLINDIIENQKWYQTISVNEEKVSKIFEGKLYKLK
jgi:hypothetical protein